MQITHYSVEAAMIVQWRDVDNIACNEIPTVFDGSTNLSAPVCLHNGTAVLDSFAFSADNLVRDLVMMVVLTVFFHMIAYTGLMIRVRRAK
jgi:hypothetical protein